MTDLFERLMGLHDEAFADAHYSTAYHVLAAALHCGIDESNTEQVAQVSRMAGERLVWIDANAPDYEHSSQSAALRGHSSIYAMLAHQAKTRVLMLQHKPSENTFSPAHFHDPDEPQNL